MNCPHSQNTADESGMAGDRPDNPLELPPSFFAFVQKAFKVWQSGDTDPEKAEQIRVLALSALAARNEDEETSIHTDGPAEPHTQGIDDERLESVEDREIESAVNRRVARRLMSHPSNF